MKPEVETTIRLGVHVVVAVVERKGYGVVVVDGVREVLLDSEAYHIDAFDNYLPPPQVYVNVPGGQYLLVGRLSGHQIWRVDHRG